MNEINNALPLHEYLRKSRTMKGLSQKKAANAIGVSENTIANWEKGNAVPAGTYFNDIVKTYDLNGEEFSYRHYKSIVKDSEEREERDNWDLILTLLPYDIAKRLKNLSLTIEEQEQLGIEAIYLKDHKFYSKKWNEYLTYKNSGEKPHYIQFIEQCQEKMKAFDGMDTDFSKIPFDYVKDIGSYNAMAIHESIEKKARYLRKPIIEYCKCNEGLLAFI